VRAAIEKEIGFHSNLHGVCMALMRMHARGEPSISAPSRSCEPSPTPPAVTVSQASRSETAGVAFIRHSVSAIASLKMGVPLTERILESRYVREHFRVVRSLLIAGRAPPSRWDVVSNLFFAVKKKCEKEELGFLDENFISSVESRFFGRRLFL